MGARPRGRAAQPEHLVDQTVTAELFEGHASMLPGPRPDRDSEDETRLPATLT